MSLLNDALRSAEQRREHPHAPAAYPGQVASGGKETSKALALVIAVAIVATLAASVLLWLWLKPDPDQMEPPLGAPLAESAALRAERVVEEPATRAEVDTPAQRSQQYSQQYSERAIDTLEVASTQPEAAVAEKVEAPESKLEIEPEPGVTAAPPRSTEPEAASQVTAAKGSDAPASEIPALPKASSGDAGIEVASVHAPAKAAPAVKQQRETPELADRRAERSIRQALSAGRFREAEAMLSDILADQPAPRSRARLARHLLVNERPEQALTWLTQDAAITDDTLRLLRARALLGSGQSEEAVALLESNVPGVRQNAEYTVTLATLLQQQGRANDAAGRWAELIAYDDANAVWWVGLAIALEADQQFRAATRAFEQAMLLPDLPPSLTDYVRRRLTELGTG